MNLPQKDIEAFQQKILSWYAENERDLPWRKTRDPYAILVSEVMSQQTQIGRVITKYEAWMKRFPTVTQLANTSTTEVLRYWSGLGYNSRALNLQKTARIIAEEYEGKFPHEIEELLELPGIGKYTAAAIACFAFDEQIPVIDTNIRKVILVEVLQETKGTKETTEKQIEKIAWRILPKGKAYTWNQALMDYSSLVLKGQKIPVSKQSHFLSSNRYYRGQIIKLLLEVKSISFSGLVDYFADRNPIEPSRLEQVVKSMAKDGLIIYHDEKLSLPI